MAFLLIENSAEDAASLKTLARRRFVILLAVVTVVIPARNESDVIGPLLRTLIPAECRSDIAVIVVACGCSDNTAQIASSFGKNVRVIDLPAGSKRRALLAGDAAATSFPRFYVDAGVELGYADLLALSAELAKPGVLAAVPQRVLALDGCALAVRWYYDIWLRLPGVRRGLFGRGVLGLNEAGHQRLRDLASLVAGDLAASLTFAPAERRVVTQARVLCRPPRSVSALVRYRSCVASEIARSGALRGALSGQTRAYPADLLGIVRAEPGTAPAIAAFLLVTAAGWIGARARGRGAALLFAGRRAGDARWGCRPGHGPARRS